MENEAIDLIPEGDGRFAYKQITFAEEHYCQLIAEGKHRSQRECYRIAIDANATDGAIDQWLHRMRKDRPDIPARIAELKASLMEERREFWMNRQWEALEKLWTLFIATVGNPDLAPIAIKCYHEIAVTLGWMNGMNPTASVTINNANGATASAGAVSKDEANAKIQKLLEHTAPQEGENDATN